jgi:broad specificity phosphatase PhoE
MDVYLVRHGQTALNVNDAFRGRIPIDLDETGQRQVALLGEYLSKTDFEALYSGPLNRTRATALAVARHHPGLQVQVSDGLDDLDFGEWSGRPREEMQRLYPAAADTWLNHPEQLRIPGGETLAEATGRAMSAIREIVARHTGTVALVTHNAMIRVLCCALLGLDESHFWSFRIDPASLTIFGHDQGRFVLKRLNERCFLSRLE